MPEKTALLLLQNMVHSRVGRALLAITPAR